MELALVILIMFVAIFTQTFSGWGLALVAMPLLSLVIGLAPARPLVALAAVSAQVAVLLRYRRAMHLQSVWQLLLGALIGIPIGVYGLIHIPEHVTMGVLGAVVLAYALYGLFRFRLPEVRHQSWGYLAGFLGGLLGGAYNTSGPPVVMYGHCREWPPARFKSNLAGFFFVSNSVIIVNHFVAGNVTTQTGRYFLYALPAMAAAAALAFFLDRYVSHELFRKIMLGLLVVLGLQLIVLKTIIGW